MSEIGIKSGIRPAAAWARSRERLARACFEFLPHRVMLDLEGWAEQDIFAH